MLRSAIATGIIDLKSFYERRDRAEPLTAGAGPHEPIITSPRVLLVTLVERQNPPAPDLDRAGGRPTAPCRPKSTITDALDTADRNLWPLSPRAEKFNPSPVSTAPDRAPTLSRRVPDQCVHRFSRDVSRFRGARTLVAGFLPCDDPRRFRTGQPRSAPARRLSGYARTVVPRLPDSVALSLRVTVAIHGPIFLIITHSLRCHPAPA